MPLLNSIGMIKNEAWPCVDMPLSSTLEGQALQAGICRYLNFCSNHTFKMVLSTEHTNKFIQTDGTIHLLLKTVNFKNSG